MNYKDALLTSELVIESGAVPLLIGESGIGKTALVRELAKRENYYYIVIDGNMLKEGEIGGLPTVEDYKVIKDGKEVSMKRTVYAVHTKLQEIDKFLEENSDGRVLLFIDEINRCEHSVQQELMNIILNREINGYRLPDGVKVMAAMNPSNKYENYAQSEYQVVDMDPAQENRFVWIEMESDVRNWLGWAINNNIDETVLEFISTFPEYLHTPDSKETVKATPRSWERVSQAYKVYLNKKDTLPSRIFFNVVKGNIGVSIAQEFNSFIENSKLPLIKPKDIFETCEFSNELIERVNKESHSRLYLTSKHTLNYISSKEERKLEVDIFSKFIQLYPVDLKIAIMQEIKENYSEVYKEFMENDVFIEGYFKAYTSVSGR